MSVCPECKGDPRGVLLLDFYVPCETCEAAKAEAKRPKPKQAKQRAPAQAKIVQHALPGKQLSVPGVGVGSALAYKLVRRETLAVSKIRWTYDYVEQRHLEDDTDIFAHVRRRWVETGGAGGANMKTTTSNNEVLFYYAFLTQHEAMASIGPDAMRNP